MRTANLLLLLALAAAPSAARALAAEAPALLLPAPPTPSLGTPRLQLAATTEAEMEERMRREALNRADWSRRRNLVLEQHDAYRPGRVLLGVPIAFVALLSLAFYDTVIADLAYRASGSVTGAQVTMVALLPVVQFGGAGAVWVIGRWLDGRGSFGPTYGVGLLTSVVAGGLGVGLLRAGKEDAALYTLLLGLPAASSIAMTITYEVTSSDNIYDAEVPRGPGRDEPDDGLSLHVAPMSGGGGLVAGLAF